MPALGTRSKAKKTPTITKNSIEVHDVEDKRLKEELEENELLPATSLGASSSVNFNPRSRLNSYTVVSQVFHNNYLYRIGDIVSLQQNDCTYYAQIRVLVEDMFSEKYAALIWLLPTRLETENSRRSFIPDNFVYGPQDEWFYNMTDLSFVMHAPTDFYKRFIFPVPKDTNFDHVVKYKFKPSTKRK